LIEVAEYAAPVRVNKALLGKPGSDGAKAAAVIQLGRRLDHFWAQLGNALAAFALAAPVKRGASSLGALALAGAAKLRHKLGLLKLGKSAGNLAHRLFQGIALRLSVDRQPP
jgi:hypothetical protein